ncbi:MAG: TM0996/MTH895 family glutaredoxin-like protein [Tenericutes bacterium]|nr:TM0996/MTH895 family glutaredoxin-like protein [Mycoplasmatota bacterium]
MQIKILGSGCKNCKKLYANVVLAADELKLDVEVTKVTDFQEIAKYNVMQTPALVIDELVVAKGRVLTIQEIKKLL